MMASEKVATIIQNLLALAAEKNQPTDWLNFGRKAVEHIEAAGYRFAHDDSGAIAGYLTSAATFESCGGTQVALMPGASVWYDRRMPSFKEAVEKGLLKKETARSIIKDRPPVPDDRGIINWLGEDAD